MDLSDFLKSALGAIVGFVLAQLINVARIAKDWWSRPRLVIEEDGNCRILSHYTQVNNGETYREEMYGFYVCNAGRSIATGVRFQLLKVEFRRHSSPKFSIGSDQVFDLSVYSDASGKRGDRQAVLVPGAKVLVHLAHRREDYDAVMPAVSALPDYYEEIAGGAREYRFTVVAFDDKARFVTRTLSVSTTRRRNAECVEGEKIGEAR